MKTVRESKFIFSMVFQTYDVDGWSDWNVITVA